jgi:replication-associated recombination protein RarA
VDEVHRWNRQNRMRCAHSRNGLVILIGATSRTRYFDVIPALVSPHWFFSLKHWMKKAGYKSCRMHCKTEERG